MKEWGVPWAGCLPPGRYSVGADIGGPDGDRDIMVIFDRKKGQLVKCFDITDYAKVQVKQIREGVFTRVYRAAREWMGLPPTPSAAPDSPRPSSPPPGP